MSFEELERKIRLLSDSTISISEVLLSFGILLELQTTPQNIRLFSLSKDDITVTLFMYSLQKQFAIVGLPENDSIDQHGFVITQQTNFKPRRVVPFEEAEPMITYLESRFSFPSLHNVQEFASKTALGILALRLCRFVHDPSDDDDCLRIYIEENVLSFKRIVVATVRTMFLENKHWEPDNIAEMTTVLQSLEDYTLRAFEKACNERQKQDRDREIEKNRASATTRREQHARSIVIAPSIPVLTLKDAARGGNGGGGGAATRENASTALSSSYTPLTALNRNVTTGARVLHINQSNLDYYAPTSAPSSAATVASVPNNTPPPRRVLTPHRPQPVSNYYYSSYHFGGATSSGACCSTDTYPYHSTSSSSATNALNCLRGDDQPAPKRIRLLRRSDSVVANASDSEGDKSPEDSGRSAYSRERSREGSNDTTTTEDNERDRDWFEVIQTRSRNGEDDDNNALTRINDNVATESSDDSEKTVECVEPNTAEAEVTHDEKKKTMKVLSEWAQELAEKKKESLLKKRRFEDVEAFEKRMKIVKDVLEKELFSDNEE